MTDRFFGLCALVLGLILFGAWAFSGPAKAQEGCIPLAAAVAKIADQGFEFIRAVPIPETGTKLVIYRSPNGFLSAYTVIEDQSCMWATGIPLGQEVAKDKGVPA